LKKEKQKLIQSTITEIHVKRKLFLNEIALHLAAWRGSIKVVQYLVEHEADLNVKNKEGKRPVDLAHHLELKAYLESFEGDEGEDKGENASDEE
jgi:ankyrin repeat protein